MGTIKDRNSRDLVGAEEIKRRWKEYTEELYQKDLNELDHMMMWPCYQRSVWSGGKDQGQELVGAEGPKQQ